MTADDDPRYVLQDLAAAARETEVLLDRAGIALDMRWDTAPEHLKSARITARSIVRRLDALDAQLLEEGAAGWRRSDGETS